jgi:thioredoxin:protein disulfide reductase
LKNVWPGFALKVAAWIGVALVVHFCTVIFLGGPIPYVVPGILGLGALHIGLLDRTPLPVSDGLMLKRGLALLMVTFAVWLGTNPGAEEKISWISYSNEAVEAGRLGGRPVMIDFTSRNCAPCLEMERKVFSHRRVGDAATPFLALRADLTVDNAHNQKLAEKFGIGAFPTVVFIGTNGAERVNLRLVGYEDALRFAQRMESAR